MAECWQVQPTNWTLCQTLNSLAPLAAVWDQLIFLQIVLNAASVTPFWRCNSLMQWPLLFWSLETQQGLYYGLLWHTFNIRNSLLFWLFDANLHCQLFKLCIPLCGLHFINTQLTVNSETPTHLKRVQLRTSWGVSLPLESRGARCITFYRGPIREMREKFFFPKIFF